MPSTTVALSPRLERKRAAAREYGRHHRAQQRAARPPAKRQAPAPRHQRAADDIGEPIAEGEWATDDFAWTEAEWSRRMAGARFSDVIAPRF